jgi:hypothetical protein
MRLSEKTLEVSFCAQLTQRLIGRPIWFGLTQRQEARFGFDTCIRLHGSLFLFQFKACRGRVGAAHRFHAPHAQMQKLQQLCINHNARRFVFYVFPLVRTIRQLRRNPNVVGQTWLLDIATLPPLPPPTTRRGSLRKNGVHYVDVMPPSATIHSEQVEVRLLSAENLAKEEISYGAEPYEFLGNDFKIFWKFCKGMSHNSAGLIVLPE